MFEATAYQLANLQDRVKKGGDVLPFQGAEGLAILNLLDLMVGSRYKSKIKKREAMVRWLERMDEERNTIKKGRNKDNGDKQTEGWVKVIRKERV